jgi:hypothetical protein
MLMTVAVNPLPDMRFGEQSGFSRTAVTACVCRNLYVWRCAGPPKALRQLDELTKTLAPAAK